MPDIQKKYSKLKKLVVDMESVVVAFSGGVDSTFLLKVCSDLLNEKALAVTATSPTYPSFEFEEAKKLAADMGCRHDVIDSNELDIPGFSENSPLRCYFCKSELFGLLKDKALELGISHVVDGTNCDDLSDYRPGKKAAEELAVRSPLVEAGLGKDEIRELSRSLGLSTWNKPSFACLSSRFPYGTDITYDRVKMVGNCEDILRELSLGQFRVRYHDEIARIEINKSEFDKLLSDDVRERVVAGFKEQGFKYVAFDLEGYRTGSMNEVLN